MHSTIIQSQETETEHFAQKEAGESPFANGNEKCENLSIAEINEILLAIRNGRPTKIPSDIHDFSPLAAGKTVYSQIT